MTRPLMLPDDVIAELGVTGFLPLAEKIARRYHTTVEAIAGRSRFRRIARARASLCYWLKRRGLSSPEVGAILNLDPSSARTAAIEHAKRHRLPPPVKLSRWRAPAAPVSGPGLVKAGERAA